MSAAGDGYEVRPALRLANPVFALVTPFTRHDRPDLGAMADALRFLEAHGVTSVVVCGSSGEFAALTLAERLEVLAAARRSFRGHLVSHVSSSSYREVRELAAASAELADALLLLPPYYFARAAEAGVEDFFVAALAGVGQPVFLYDFPRHTQNPLGPELVRRLRERLPALVGIKDSGGDLEAARRHKSAGFAVFLGGDRLLLRVLEAGLDGSVTGAGSALPELLVGIDRAHAAGDRPRAAALQAALDRWNALRAELPLADVAVVKEALARRLPGFPTRVRPPLVAAGHGERRRIHCLIDELAPAG